MKDQQDDWDAFVQPLTYAYNSKKHCLSNRTPSNITLREEHPSPGDKSPTTAIPSDGNKTIAARSLRQRLLEGLITMKIKTSVSGEMAQEWHKRYLDKVEPK